MQKDTTKEEKFEEIYRIYENEVFKISSYYTNDEYTAHDIVQKAFYKLFQHIGCARKPAPGCSAARACLLDLRLW